MSDREAGQIDAATDDGASRLQVFGVLLTGGGLGSSLIAYPAGVGVPLLPAILGIGVILLTVDWLMRHA